MYTVKNTAIDGVKGPKGEKLEWKSNFLNSKEDKAMLRAIAKTFDISIPKQKGKTVPDHIKLQENVQKALELDWIAQETIDSTLEIDGRDLQKELAKTTDISHFYRTYASVNMGLHRLTPNSEALLVDDEEVIQQLIDSGIAKYITVLKDGKEVYRGCVVDDKLEIEVLENNKRVSKMIDVKRVGNKLHPKHENIIYEGK